MAYRSTLPIVVLISAFVVCGCDRASSGETKPEPAAAPAASAAPIAPAVNVAVQPRAPGHSAGSVTVTTPSAAVSVKSGAGGVVVNANGTSVVVPAVPGVGVIPVIPGVTGGAVGTGGSVHCKSGQICNEACVGGGCQNIC